MHKLGQASFLCILFVRYYLVVSLIDALSQAHFEAVLVAFFASKCESLCLR